MININERVVDQKEITKMLRSVGFVKKQTLYKRSLQGAWYYKYSFEDIIRLGIDYYITPLENSHYISIELNFGSWYIRHEKFNDPDGEKLQEFVKKFVASKRYKIGKETNYSHPGGGAFIRYPISIKSERIDQVTKNLVEFVTVFLNYHRKGKSAGFGKYSHATRGKKL